eukprot:4947707-Amphidinium_carterae.2
MVRTRELEPEERAADSAIRGLEDTWRTEKVQIDKILKKHPHARVAVLRLLTKSLKLSAEEPSAPVPLSNATKAAKERQANMKRKRAEEC